MKQLLATLALLFTSNLANAGGHHFTAEIQDFQAKGRDEFVMTLMRYNHPWNDKFTPAPAKIHLRHRMKSHSKRQYLDAINVLLKQFAKGGKFLFGIMGDGYDQISGREGEFQSNGLRVFKYDDGKIVVYSNPP